MLVLVLGDEDDIAELGGCPLWIGGANALFRARGAATDPALDALIAALVGDSGPLSAVEPRCSGSSELAHGPCFAITSLCLGPENPRAAGASGGARDFRPRCVRMRQNTGAWRMAAIGAPVHGFQHRAVQVDVQVGSRPAS